MAQESQHTHSASPQELLRAAQAARETGRQQRVPVEKGYLVVSFFAREPKQTPRRGKRFSMSDPLWELRGIVDGPGPTDVSTNKDHYLAEAYASKPR